MIDLKRVEKQSVQSLPDASNGVAPASWDLWNLFPARGPILSPFGTRVRERELRQWDREDYALLWSGAVSGLLNRWSAAQWELKSTDDDGGEDESGDAFHDVLTQAHFGQGWTSFIKMVGRDFLRHDIGAFIEVIGPGPADGPITGAVSGIAHLDSLRCIPSGNPEFPVFYYSTDGKLHKMHRTRVFQIVDMPDGDESYPGVGRCALSRAITILEREVLMNRYIRTSLDDVPKPGIGVIAGMSPETREKAIQAYINDQNRDEKVPFGRTLWLHALDAVANPLKVELLSFSEPPEQFNFKDYTELNVNALALALGVDKLDLWELTSSALGSGQQSQVMASKSKGRTFGAFVTEIERFVNDVLPDTLEFAFNTRDSQDDMDTAKSAQLWSSVSRANADVMNADERRRFLANQVESINDAITDEAGNVTRYNDTSDQTKPEDIAPASDQQQGQPPPQQGQEPAQKAFSDTRSEFINHFIDLVKAGAADDLTRRRFGIVLRAQLQRLGRQAYKDGLEAGGVVDEMTPDDDSAITDWVKAQSGYVTAFADELYKRGLPESMIAVRARLWANKSLETMYHAGVASADRNGMYEWKLGMTEKHCKTCLALDGQIHRMSTYTRRRLLPKSDKLDCKGYECDCGLHRRNGAKAVGRLPKSVEKMHHAHHRPRDEHGRFVKEAA